MGAEPAEEGQDPIKMVGGVELIVGLLLATQVFLLVQQADGDGLILTLAPVVYLALNEPIP
jgi:hypothetical protein